MGTPTIYSHESRIGQFLLRLLAGKGWRIEHEGEVLGAGYRTAQQALDDLCGGHCDWAGTTDPSTLGLADEIGDWTPMRLTR